MEQHELEAGETPELTGLQKTAIFFSTLDEDTVVEIFRHLDPREVEQITGYMGRIGKIPAEEVHTVMEEFERRAMLPDFIPQTNVKRVLSRTFSEHHVAVKLLQELDPQTMITLIGNEHPQIIAFILAHLGSNISGQVLAALPEEVRTDVLMRLIHLDSSSPEVMTEVEEVLKSKMASMRGIGAQKVGGIQVVIDLLNQMDRTNMNAVLSKIGEEDPTLAEEIDKRLVSFEDLAALDNRGLQTLLKEVEREDLMLALKTSGDEIKSRIFRNMSEHAALMLKEDLEVMGPVRLKDVEQAQQKIAAIARRMEADGTIILARRGGTGETFV